MINSLLLCSLGTVLATSPALCQPADTISGYLQVPADNLAGGPFPPGLAQDVLGPRDYARNRSARVRSGLRAPLEGEGSSPRGRVDAANRAALQEPTGHDYINAAQVYRFTEGAVYRLYASPGEVSDIALQPGEGLVSVASGDTVRWTIGDTSSGTGESKRTHILVKPNAPGLKTNLVIATTRRVYHLQLESTERTAMAMLSWTYPADGLLAISRQYVEPEAVIPKSSDMNAALNFGYRISGDTPSWRPLRAFDDGVQVFIEFPQTLGQGEAPPLFVKGPKGEVQLVNYRVRANYYIVDRLFSDAELRLGSKHQDVVRIERTRAKKGSGTQRRGKQK
ncbi:MAG: P-type conjugative transfer protein TrbG [Sphingorhabdus sp.]